MLECPRQRELCVQRQSYGRPGYALGTQKRSGAQGWEKKVVSWQPREECFKSMGVVIIARNKRNVESVGEFSRFVVIC